MGEPCRPELRRHEPRRPEPGRSEPRRPWTRERVARLAFLAGQGRIAKLIAADPLVATSEGNVYRQAARLGISLAETGSSVIALRLTMAAIAAVDGRAARAGLTREAYLRALVLGQLRAPEAEPG